MAVITIPGTYTIDQWRLATNDISANQGDLTLLNTTDKSSLVGAINDSLSIVGSLSSLNTTDKSSTVNAINEVLGQIGDLDPDLNAIAALTTFGLITRTADGVAATRTITGTTNRITVSNGDGVAGNPVLNIGSDVALRADVLFVGTTSIALNRTSAALNLTGIDSITSVTSSPTLFDNSGGTITIGSQAVNVKIGLSAKILMGTNTPSTYSKLKVVASGYPYIETTNSDTTSVNKAGGLIVTHYTSSAPLLIVQGASDSTNNTVKVGGGVAGYNASTKIEFYTAPNTTTTSGTKVADFDSVGTLSLNATTAVKLPGGTTIQRPTGVVGMMRYNSNLDSAELYSAAAGWKPIAGSVPITEIAVDSTALPSNHYYCTASLILTLPASPLVSDTVVISNFSGGNVTIARNGNKIMKLSEDMVVDVTDKTFTLKYANSSSGWILV